MGSIKRMMIVDHKSDRYLEVNSIDESLVNNTNVSLFQRLRSFNSLIIRILLIVIVVFIVLVLLISYCTVLPVPWVHWVELSRNTRSVSESMYNSKRIISKNKINNFSKFRCTGDENNIDTWPDRLCVFNNICYNLKAEQFEYYRRVRTPKFPLFYDSKRGMLTEFTGSNGFVLLTSRGGHAWTPTIIDQPCPSTDVAWLTNLHTIWKEYFGDDNFGHVVSEDMGSISYSLDRMNEQDEQLVVMHVNEVSNQTNFQKYLTNIIASLTPQTPVEYKSYLKAFNSSYACFRRFIVGGNLNLINAAGRKENDGKEALFYRWRSKIVTFNHFDPEYVPSVI